MKSASAFSRRLPWLNISVSMLMVLLQRTPAVRILAHAKDYVLASRAGELLRAGFTAAALGATHSLAGATAYVQSPANPVQGTVGSPLEVGFTFTGAPSDPQHFVIMSGQPPPGMNFIPAPVSGNILSQTPAIAGTPTQGGSFSVVVRAIGVAGESDPVTIEFQIAGGGAVTAPSIAAPPQSQTVNAGAAVTFSVQASGTAPLMYQWKKDNMDINGATSATLNLTNVTTANSGTYTVVVTNSAGSATSSAATLTVNTPGGGVAPAIALQPLGFTAASGSTATFNVVATGTSPTYQWRRGGVPIGGATDATLVLSGVTAANAGDYTVVVSNSAGTATSSVATLQIAGGESRLVNLSVRANLATEQTLIVGFATSGPKNLLLRGIGPTLTSFDVPGAYADPRLELFNTAEPPVMIDENNDWNASLVGVFNSVGAFPLVIASKDAAIQREINGGHSAHLKGPSSGVALVEVYDAGSGSARLVNVSARNIVGTGDNVLIAGFFVDGTVGRTLLIRAIGPTLADFGVEGTLVDPKLEIFNGDAVKIVENDNWTTTVGGKFNSVGAFPLTANSRDAALLVTLMPGLYTAKVSGVADGTGEALVEVYAVP